MEESFTEEIQQIQMDFRVEYRREGGSQPPQGAQSQPTATPAAAGIPATALSLGDRFDRLKSAIQEKLLTVTKRSSQMWEMDCLLTIQELNVMPG